MHGEGPIDDALSPAETIEPSLQPIAGDAVVEPSSAALGLALDHAFRETDRGPRRTHAVVVVHRGRIIAERKGPRISTWAASAAHCRSSIGTARGVDGAACRPRTLGDERGRRAERGAVIPPLA
jgi:hypothetical protein